jgi:RNase P subunit RPR2
MSYDEPQLRITDEQAPAENDPKAWEILDRFVMRPADPLLRGSLSRNCEECHKLLVQEASAEVIRTSLLRCGWCGKRHRWTGD